MGSNPRRSVSPTATCHQFSDVRNLGVSASCLSAVALGAMGVDQFGLHGHSCASTKSSTVTVAPVPVMPTSQVPLLTAMSVMDRFVQAVALPMASVLSVPPNPLA